MREFQAVRFFRVFWASDTQVSGLCLSLSALCRLGPEPVWRSAAPAVRIGVKRTTSHLFRTTPGW